MPNSTDLFLHLKPFRTLTTTSIVGILSVLAKRDSLITTAGHRFNLKLSLMKNIPNANQIDYEFI